MFKRGKYFKLRPQQPLRTMPVTLDKRHLKSLARAKLLQAIGKGKGIVHFVVLKNIKAAIKRNFPAVVGHDVAGMEGVAAVKLP